VQILLYPIKKPLLETKMTIIKASLVIWI